MLLETRDQISDTEGMAEHQALYRKWRSQRFSEVVGQTYALKTLVNALSSGEVGHAYLFAGPRGTGKTTVARLFAKAVNCENSQGGEPCNECGACLRIARGASLDVVEIDGASNRGIDQIRKLREEVNFVAADVRNKVYIIDEVHMLTNEAFNALLKTLEEPPKRVIFIFATTEVNKLPPTVTSRCQAFEFTRIAPEDVVNHLRMICEAEGIQAEDKALQTIASRCGGAMRDALVTLEQVAAYAQGAAIQGETLETVLGLPSESMLQGFLSATLNGDGQSALATLEDLTQRGRDLELFLEELIRMSRDWLVAVVAKQPLPINASPPAVASLTKHLLNLKRDMNRAWDKKIWFEVGLLEWLHANTDGTQTQSSAEPVSQPQAQTQPTQTPAPQPAQQEVTPTPSAPKDTATQPVADTVAETVAESPPTPSASDQNEPLATTTSEPVPSDQQPEETATISEPDPAPPEQQTEEAAPVVTMAEQSQLEPQPEATTTIATSEPIQSQQPEQSEPVASGPIEAVSTPEEQTTQASAPVASDSGPSDGEPLGLDQAWRQLLDAVREDRVAVYAYLVEGLPQFHENKLSVLYDPHHRFHKESIEKDEIKSYVLEIVKRLFGAEVTMNIGFQERAASSDPPPSSSDSEPDSDAPVNDTPAAPPPSRAHSASSSLDEKAALVQKMLGAEQAE